MPRLQTSEPIIGQGHRQAGFIEAQTDERWDPMGRFRCGGRDARGLHIPCGSAVASSVNLVMKSGRPSGALRLREWDAMRTTKGRGRERVARLLLDRTTVPLSTVPPKHTVVVAIIGVPLVACHAPRPIMRAPSFGSWRAPAAGIASENSLISTLKRLIA